MVEYTRSRYPALFAAVNIAQLTDHVKRLREQGIKLVIIDTPPQTLDTINNANAVADFVLIPARPSPHDLRAVAAVVEMVEEAKKPFCFVINGATPRSIIAKQAVSALAEHGKVAPATIHQRVDFAASMTDGRTVSELAPESPSAKEITALCKYVFTQLSKYVKGD
jgi:chromosome partitioning protein